MFSSPNVYIKTLQEVVLYYMNTYLLLHVLVMPLIIFTNMTVEFQFSLFLFLYNQCCNK